MGWTGRKMRGVMVSGRAGLGGLLLLMLTACGGPAGEGTASPPVAGSSQGGSGSEPDADGLVAFCHRYGDLMRTLREGDGGDDAAMGLVELLSAAPADVRAEAQQMLPWAQAQADGDGDRLNETRRQAEDADYQIANRCQFATAE
jgi:hypothetical protein